MGRCARKVTHIWATCDENPPVCAAHPCPLSQGSTPHPEKSEKESASVQSEESKGPTLP